MSAMEKKQKKPSRVMKFFRELKSEIKKVVFPSAKQTRINTTVVIITVLVFGIIIAILDFAFVNIRNFTINYEPKTTEQEVPVTEDAINVDDLVDVEVEETEPTEAPEGGNE